jgi:hypothetical protein
MEGRHLIWKQTPPISAKCYHPHQVENGKEDSSSEAHLQSLKLSDVQVYKLTAQQYKVAAQHF